MSRLAGKVAVITGGSSGIGRATVERFVGEGAKVVFGDIQDDKGRALADELGAQAVYQNCDVMDEAAIEGLIATATAKFGRLDCMFNNAGAPGVSDSILDIEIVDFDKAVSLLLRSVFLGIKHAGRVMVPQNSGSIISTASVAGIRGGFGPHIYAATKSAVINLTRSVGQELAEKNIRTNCICPGGIATSIFGVAMDLPSQVLDDSAERMKPVLAMMQPIPRAGLPEDIANAALFLASDDSSFVNGHALVVDGGLTTGGKYTESQARGEMMRKVMEKTYAGE
jgi:NAD(P)-dependent dehydrogenase (short-subunit alcohol dehydrogenase family)